MLIKGKFLSYGPPFDIFVFDATSLLSHTLHPNPQPFHLLHCQNYHFHLTRWYDRTLWRQTTVRSKDEEINIYILSDLLLFLLFSRPLFWLGWSNFRWFQPVFVLDYLKKILFWFWISFSSFWTWQFFIF